MGIAAGAGDDHGRRGGCGGGARRRWRQNPHPGQRSRDGAAPRLSGRRPGSRLEPAPSPARARALLRALLVVAVVVLVAAVAALGMVLGVLGQVRLVLGLVLRLVLGHSLSSPSSESSHSDPSPHRRSHSSRTSSSVLVARSSQRFVASRSRHSRTALHPVRIDTASVALIQHVSAWQRQSRKSCVHVNPAQIRWSCHCATSRVA